MKPPASWPLPRLPAALLRSWVPRAERDEVLEDLGTDYARYRERRGRLIAGLWLWRQTLGSLPALVGRSWWRGWTGFEPDANRMRPGGSSMETWIMDLRYAARRLRARPTYALLAILTIALGVGGTAAIYSIVRELLIRPLPYTDEDNVVVFWAPFDWAERELVFLRPQVPAFKEIVAFRTADVTLELGTAPAQLLQGIASSAELFSVLGAAPAIGRTFRAGEDVKGAEAVAVLSHAMWRKLGSDPSILGRRLRMGGVERTVIGIMPPNFWFPDPSIEVWVPAEINPEEGSGNYTIVGRLAASQRLEAMATPLAQITRALGERYKYPEKWDKTKNAKLTPVREYLIGSLRPALLATSAAMALILLIACANVAALMLGQVNNRSAELAVRSALGADRRRLTQQLVAEALLIGLLAGMAGAGLASGGFRLLVASLPLGAWA
ncbi:MAG: ABC transporter permease, partial [Gemmatimonadota bacterium]